jgi:hypothetical protein
MESVLRRRVPRHERHLVLTLGTLGLWGLCWIITMIAARWEPWRCTDCQQPQEKEVWPQDREEEPPAEAAVGALDTIAGNQ